MNKRKRERTHLITNVSAFVFFNRVQMQCRWKLGIGILREYFDKNNLEDFKRLCGIVLILWDFKRFFLKDFLQSGFLTQDFNGFLTQIFKISKYFMDF